PARAPWRRARRARTARRAPSRGSRPGRRPRRPGRPSPRARPPGRARGARRRRGAPGRASARRRARARAGCGPRACGASWGWTTSSASPRRRRGRSRQRGRPWCRFPAELPWVFPSGSVARAPPPGLEPGPRAPKTLVLPITPRRNGPGVDRARCVPGPRRAGWVREQSARSVPLRGDARVRLVPSAPTARRGPHHTGRPRPARPRGAPSRRAAAGGVPGPAGLHGMMVLVAEPRRTPRSRMTASQRREQLLAVSRGLFAEKGFEGTSVEEIAARAEVSKPVVYEHFGGKEGIYAVVVDREV